MFWSICDFIFRSKRLPENELDDLFLKRNLGQDQFNQSVFEIYELYPFQQVEASNDSSYLSLMLLGDHHIQVDKVLNVTGTIDEKSVFPVNRETLNTR